MAQIALYVTLAEIDKDHVELRYWTTNPNDSHSRNVSLDAIRSLIDRAEREYTQPSHDELKKFGQVLYRWLDGSDRHLSTEIAKLRGAGPIALALDISQNLAHLPWEVLHDGNGFLVAAPNPPVVPVRWCPGQPWPGPGNHALKALFMATSPLYVAPELNYEEEEARILKAAERLEMTLDVEESGNLQELRLTATEDGGEPYDVFHLTGHGDIQNGVPVFLTEDEVGGMHLAPAKEIADALPNQPRPNLVFVSGCRTAQASPDGLYRSLAEGLLEHGFRCVLGWGKPVFESDATEAAGILYGELASGQPLIGALARTYTGLIDANWRHWHLLRLFVAGGMPETLVTPRGTKGRRPAKRRTHTVRYLDAEGEVKVVGREEFVGRRRPLQRLLRALAKPNEYPLGALIQGMGGVGKSTVAARLCDRLEGRLVPVILFGALTEARLVEAVVKELPDDADLRQRLRDPNDELSFRLRAVLRDLTDRGRTPFLFVLDDFEQNMKVREGGVVDIDVEPLAVLNALSNAIREGGRHRLLMTSRYRPAGGAASGLFVEELRAMQGSELTKKLLGVLNGKTVAKGRGQELHALALEVADGNPRLLEWVYEVLNVGGLEHEAILSKVAAQADRFRMDAFARELLATLEISARRVLAAARTFEIPVPLAAVRALLTELSEAGVESALDRVIALGLAEREVFSGEALIRVSSVLGPLLDSSAQDRDIWQQRGCQILYDLWIQTAESSTESQRREIIRLGIASKNIDVVVSVTDRLGYHLLQADRNREAKVLLEESLTVAIGDYRLLGGLAQAEMTLGNGVRATGLFRTALAACPPEDERERAHIAHYYTERLKQEGNLNEMLSVLQDEQLPVFERLGDARSKAVTMGRIADVLQARGELDEALRIRREEELPVFERLGDAHSKAVTIGKIADVLQARGELDEALRIRWEEELPVFERLGDARSKAVTMGKIADVLQARGELDEALRIRREEQLPVYERLGDAREMAVTMGRIADVLQARGELDEALRIRREEQLPVYERLGDAHSLIVCQAKIAICFIQRGRPEDVTEAAQLLMSSYQSAVERRYKEAEQILQFITQLMGQPEQT